MLVGHSLGGLLAQVLAAEGRCRAAVLIEPGPAITPSMVRKTAARYGAEVMELAGHSHWMMEEPGWELVASRIEGWVSGVIDGVPTASEPSRANGD